MTASDQSSLETIGPRVYYIRAPMAVSNYWSFRDRDGRPEETRFKSIPFHSRTLTEHDE